MERLQEQIATADKALKTLEEVYEIETPSAIERNAFIQRFEYTFESVGKLGKEYLREIEGMDMGSPKMIICSSGVFKKYFLKNIPCFFVLKRS